MTYPQQPYPQYPQYPPQGQPGYPQAPQPGYPVAPPQPQYQQQPPPMPYLPQGQPGYPQQGYAPQQPPYQPPMAQPPLPRGSLEEFMEQPSGGGGSATSKFFTRMRPQGSWLQLQVQRNHTSNDVQVQTDSNQQPQFFKTGGQPDPRRPKLVLILKCNVIGASDPGYQQIFTDGMSSIWVKGITRDALVTAMATAGVPDPARVLAKGKLGGAVITMISAGFKPANRPGFSDTNLFDFQYQPGGHEMEAFEEDASPTAAAPAAAPLAAVPPATMAPAMQAPPAPAGYGQLPQLPSPATAPAPAPGVDPAAYYQATGQQMQQAPPTPPPGPAAYAPPPTAPAPPPPGPQVPGVAEQPQYQQYAVPQQVPVPPPGYPNQPQQAPPAPPVQSNLTPEQAATLARLNGGQ